jgi:hypothetical protein
MKRVAMTFNYSVI